MIDQISLEYLRKTKIKDDEIEIKIEYASLNFKDYLKIRRALPDKSISNTYYKNSLGMEASGVVTKAGLMTDFRVNERVIIGHPDGTLVNKIVAKPKDMTVLRWGDLDLTSAELTTIPIAYVTSYYALEKLAKVNQGDCSDPLSHRGGWPRSYLNCIISQC